MSRKGRLYNMDYIKEDYNTKEETKWWKSKQLRIASHFV